jgi:hypothetical protein
MREHEYASEAVRAKADEYGKLAEEAKIKAEKEEMERKHSELLEAIKNSPQGIVEAVKGIPETKVPDHSKEYKKWKDEIVKALKIDIPDVDLGPVIKAINSIKIPEVRIPESKDYTKILKAIKDSLPENTDLSRVEELIANIKPFEIPDRLLTKDGTRLKVEVDRISLGSGTGTVTDPTILYKISDIDETGYYGYLREGGAWYIMQGIAGTYRYARGNTDYATAWSGRAGLTYDYFNLIF